MPKDLSLFIEELKQKNDIADVIGRYVTLTRNGSKFWGRCPFHNEKTPSFAVNSDGQYYHCFGCGASGDVIKFIQETESLDFMKAVEFLCDKCGMKLPDDFGGGGDTAELKKQRDRLYALLKDAARYYHSCLREKGGEMVKYLTGRGVSEEYITRFGIGYSPDFSGLVSYLKNAGYTEEEMKASGAAQDKNGKLYDHLGTRLIIPIINSQGDVIAFGGRDMTGESGAKYKNTAETMVFNKSKNLYAVNLVKKSRDRHKGVIVVEGYMDAIALHQAGFSGAVASMGTSLTKEQAKIIKNFSQDVYICYDGDSAGQAATMRGLDILRQAGLNVRVMSMPEGTDPDEYIEKYGREGFEKLMESSPPLSDFKLGALLKQYDIGSADGKRKYTGKALEVISREENSAVKEELLKLLRTQTGITYESLKRDLENIGAAAENKAEELPEEEGEKAAETPLVKAARFILYCVLNGLDFAKDYKSIEEFLTEPAHIKIFSYIKSCYAEHKDIRKSSLFENCGNNAGEITAVLESGEGMGALELLKYYEDCMNLFAEERFSRKLKILTDSFEQEKDVEKRKKLALEIQVLTMEQRKNLNKGSKS